MDGKTGARRQLWRAGALVVVAAFVMLTAGCGLVHVHFGSSGSNGTATFVPNRAFARCARSHGLPNFPNPAGSDSITMQVHGHNAAVRAYHDCKHLLAGG